MTSSNVPKSSSANLLNQLIARYDHLLQRQLSDRWEGTYVTDNDPPARLFTCCDWWSEKLELGPDDDLTFGLLVGWMFCFPCDMLLFVVRACLFPVVWIAWHVERLLGRCLGVTYFCPYCHHSTLDPYVYCPDCLRVQGRLSPSMAGLFLRPCGGCGKTRLPVFGNYLARRPPNLICRNTRRSFGCYRPDPLVRQTPCTARHLAVTGTTARSRHAVLAHLAHQAIHGQAATPSQVPWEFNQLEMQMLRDYVSQSYISDTQSFDQPSPRYALARSLMLQLTPRKLLVLHHLIDKWLGSETELYRSGPNWRTAHGLVFVVDLEAARSESQRPMLTHAEVLERIVRSVQTDIPLEPNSALPLQLAIVVPIRPGGGSGRPISLATQFLAADAEELVRQHCPSLYAIVRRCVPAKKLRFFAGRIPDRLQLEQTRWLGDVIKWLN